MNHNTASFRTSS